MTREEAINEIKSWDFLEGKEIEAIHTLIPELKESEDERIRKGLIEALKTSKTVGELKFVIPYPTREECIAYLEKQKEPENTSASTMVPSCWEVEQEEPKPAEWSEEDEMYLSQAIETLEHENYSILADKLKSIRNRVGKEFLQPHWKPSEEQIKTLKCLPGLLRNFKLDSSARMLEVLYEQLKKLM